MLADKLEGKETVTFESEKRYERKILDVELKRN